MNRRRATFRITAVAVFFCLACIVFGARLVSLQLINRDAYAPASVEATLTLTTPIKAQRGSICDRNGVVLVYNKYTYDLTIDYFTLPATVREENETFIALASAAAACGIDIIDCENYPLTGTYPDMTYVPSEAATRAEIVKWYRRKAGISAPDLAKYLAGRYDLLKNDGSLVCTPEEALLIMNLRWSMIEADFQNSGTYTLASDIGLDLITLVSESEISGAKINTNSTRTYTYPGYGSHIFGQLGRIYAEDWPQYQDKGYPMDALVGISGCEKVFEDYLCGIDGEVITEYDKNGYIINQYVKTEPRAGRDVWITIDMELQIAAEDGLRENIEYARQKATGELTGEDAAAGAFTMTDVNTGQVLAMASHPTYDLTNYNKDYENLASAEVSPLLNRAINGLYAPGSTYKVGVAAAALTAGTINTDTIINTRGRYSYFPDYQPRCWLYVSTGNSHGPINVGEAVRVSCNYFFYELGRLLGIDKLNEFSKGLGLGQPTGFELGGETGVLAGPAYRNALGLAKWRETDTIVAAIGQSENLFSPLQLNMYIAAIANGGTRYAATLFYDVKNFSDTDSNTNNTTNNATDNATGEKRPPTVQSQVELNGRYKRVLLDAMENVITSSYTLRDMFSRVPVSVAGKTGTAQVGTTKSENALFVAVAPAGSPQVAVACVIEQGHAGSYAAYTAAKVLEIYFNK